MLKSQKTDLFLSHCVFSVYETVIFPFGQSSELLQYSDVQETFVVVIFMDAVDVVVDIVVVDVVSIWVVVEVGALVGAVVLVEVTVKF